MGISIPSALALGASAGSAGAGLFGLFGSSNSSAPQQFQTPNMAGAANSAYSGIGNLGNYNLYGQNIGQAQGITSGLVNNPYAQQYQGGANTASGLGATAGLGAFNSGGNLQGAGNAVLNTAFDPQQALYNQTLAQTQAQQNAANAAAGVGTTPYGAGLQDQNLQNFNIAWQQQQLQNQISGLGAAGSAYGQGAGLQSQGVGTYLNSQQTPYNVYGQIGSGQIGALNQLGQFGQSASTIPQTQIGDYQSYLGGGVSQQNANTASASLANQEQQQYLSQIFGGLGGLGSAYGLSGLGSTGYGGGNSYYSPAYSGAGGISSAAIY